MTHTSVNCTWDEPEEGNAKNEILFKDGFEDKVDLDDFIAPEIDEGYDPDEDEEQGANQEVGIDSCATSSEESEEEVIQSKPEKKLIKTEEGSKKANSLRDLLKTNKENAFSDFDKSKKRAKGLKISFQNPLESKLQDEDDHTLGKRVYHMKNVRPPTRRDDEFRVGNSRLEDNDEDFFEGDEGEGRAPRYDEEDDEDNRGSKLEKVKLKFKERMKEKKKMAKLEKERKRNELRALKDEKYGNKSKITQDLELIAGDEAERPEFKPNFKDSRFIGAFEDPDMAIDTTSTMFKKDKHAAMLIEKKKHRSQFAQSN